MENDNVCGITTGGEENCEWDCIPSLGSSYYQNPECLIDCFEANHCAVEAINDYKAANGICIGSSFGDLGATVYPTSTKECDYTTLPSNITYTTRGIFSENTLELLIQNETCIYDVHRKSPVVYNTFQLLVYTSSDLTAFQYWYYFSGKLIGGFPEETLASILPLPFTFTRLHPGAR